MTVRVLKFLSAEKTLWKLLFKTAVAVLAVGLISPIGPIGLIVTLAVFAAVYFREIEEKKFFRTSFWLLPVLVLAAIGLIGPISPIGPIAVFAVLFFVLLGLINLFFKERFLVYGVFNAAVLVALSLLFFFLLRPGNFWLSGTVFFAALFLILRENLGFLGPFSGRRATLSAGIIAFLGLELSYFLQFLSLGFINAAVYLALFLVLVREAAVSSIKGSFSFSFMMRQITLFAVLSIVVFAVSLR